MPRINPVDPNNANAKSKTLLEGVTKAMGMTPNILATMAHSPAVLESYLGFSKTLAGASLSPQLREQIALAVASANGCEYCASAHTAAGKGAGLNDEELGLSLLGESSDPKAQAALRFSLAIVDKKGWVNNEDITAFKAAGFGDTELTEVVAVVALNTFTNLFNHVVETEVDFPRVSIPAKAGV